MEESIRVNFGGSFLRTGRKRRAEKSREMRNRQQSPVLLFIGHI